jgi:hypothetical protein
MSFKENLLKKIEIDQTAQKILRTVGPYDSGMKVDKQAVRELLEFCDYSLRKERGMELYLEPGFSETGRILVLDNELKYYRTTVADVVLRKNPFVKEMVSIRNIIKILNDKDVVLSNKEESVKVLQKECIDRLDLSYGEADLDEIIKDGIASLDKDYAEGVIECLTLLAELLGYLPPPKILRMTHHTIYGRKADKDDGDMEYGPIVIYSLIHNKLLLLNKSIDRGDSLQAEFLARIAAGKEKADMEGHAVFAFLKQEILKQKG